MEERTNVTKFQGNSVILLGPALKVGDQAPDFQVVDTSLTPVTLADFKGKTKIICTVPSIDTPVCDTEVRRFNQEAAQLPDSMVVLTISLDLPSPRKTGVPGQESSALQLSPIIRIAALAQPMAC